MTSSYLVVLFSFFLFIPYSSAEVISHTEYRSYIYAVSENEAYIGVKLTPEEGWHTYWSNPGEAGQAPYIELTDESLKVELLELPAPKRFEVGGIVGYGYEAATLYLYKVTGTLPETLDGTLNWLVCNEDSCLPGEVDFSLYTEKSEEVPKWLQMTAHPKGGLKLKKEVSSPSSKNAGEGTWEFSFTSEEDLSAWSVFPYSEKFSEENGEVKLQKEGKSYRFSFKCLGEPPAEKKFLITNGESAGAITL